MQRLAPYQSGLWLAEYFNNRCQLCRIYRSEQQWSPSSTNRVDIPAKSLLLSVSRRLNKGLLCSRCHDLIMWLPTPFTVDMAVGSSLTIQAASYYDYPIRQAIRAFKHHEDMTRLPLLVHAVRQLPRPQGCHAANSVIIPMPTTASRLMKRGFDPVTVLSAYLSQHWQIPLWHGVQRIDNTVSQQGLSRAERLTNLDNAFTLTEPPPVKRLLLFDDVATTGASLQALARTLLPQSVMESAVTSQSPIGPNAHTSSANPYQITAYALAHGSSYHK
ncbi:ComF family protein [Psychrobacter frigidicola]|uniref:ComF family protein n=1 Tax=Psychrobacter frigidicola TaxID=45611 RepID=UPI001D0FEA72|nr:ComF family protein [Psychrobacter frigidicola]